MLELDEIKTLRELVKTALVDAQRLGQAVGEKLYADDSTYQGYEANEKQQYRQYKESEKALLDFINNLPYA